MVELRRKSKPTPTNIQPPTDPEDWIAQANADGDPHHNVVAPENSARRQTAKATEKRPQSHEKRDKLNRSIPTQSSSPLVESRYISFAIDSISLNLFRELCFTLNKGNTATLAHIIETCVQMGVEEFQRYPESQVIIGNIKRTMSFLLPQSSLDTLYSLAKRLRFRNKSALNRYLIQLFAHHYGMDSQSARWSQLPPILRKIRRIHAILFDKRPLKADNSTIPNPA